MRRRSANSVIRAAITIAVLWFVWSWVSGDPVLVPRKLPQSGTCLGGLPCKFLRPELRIAGRLVVPHQVLSGAALAVAVLLYSRRRLRRLSYGPLRLAEVNLLATPDAKGVASSTATITALIMECLRVRDVRAHGVIPSYSGIDARSSDLQGAPAYPTPTNLLTRTLTALAQSSVVDQGFTVTVTQTPAQLPYQVGLTFTIQRVATGAIELVDTCWARSLDEGARKVGFRLVAWQEESLRRGRRGGRRPGPTPNATSMRHQYAALIEGWHRRYDGAVHFAREGLRVDPGNVALRLHLGETYERLGLGLDAMIVYASGLIGLDDQRNGWRNRPDDERASPAGQQPTALEQIEANAWHAAPRRRRPQHRDSDSAGLLWRYIANLGMSERWVDVLIAETARVDDVYRNPDTTAGDHPWFTERDPSPWPRMTSTGVDIDLAVSEARERSGLVRGFLSKRYDATLRREFPLLHAAWFQERDAREKPFGPDGRGSVRTTLADAHLEPSVRGLLARASAWRPPTTLFHLARTPRDSYDDQLADLVACIEALRQMHEGAWKPVPSGSTVGVEALIDGTRRCFTSALQYVITPAGTAPQADAGGLHRRRPDDPDRLEAESDALSAMTPGHAAEWAAWRVNRPLVVSVVTRLTAQLSAVHRFVSETYLSPGDAAAPGALGPLDALMHQYSPLFGRVAASLDMQLVLSMCAMTDLEDMLNGRAETPPLADMRRSQLLWTMAQHRYCARLLYLERAHGFGRAHEAGNGEEFLATADALILDAHERIRHILDRGLPRRLLVWGYAAAATARWRGHILGRDDEPWSQAYYAACAYAVTIPDYPGSIDGEASPISGPGEVEPDLAVVNTYHQWCSRYDAVAKLAIHHLDQAVSLRARSRGTGRSRGVADWILDEDPDLDLLRRHPRFRRWAAQRFQVTLLPDWRSPAFRAMRSRRFLRSIELPAETAPGVVPPRPRTLLFRERCALGVLGSAVPWNRSYIRWGLTHTHYLLTGMFATIPAVIDQLGSLGQSLAGGTPGAGAGEMPSRAVAAQVADDLARFWSTVPLYRTLNTSPELRLEIGVLLRDNGGLQHTLWPQFPREADVLIDARFLFFATLDERLLVRAPLGLASAERLQRWADGPAVRNTAADGANAARACAHQLAGLLADVEDSLASPPSRRSLRRRAAHGRGDGGEGVDG